MARCSRSSYVSKQKLFRSCLLSIRRRGTPPAGRLLGIKGVAPVFLLVKTYRRFSLTSLTIVLDMPFRFTHILQWDQDFRKLNHMLGWLAHFFSVKVIVDFGSNADLFHWNLAWWSCYPIGYLDEWVWITCQPRCFQGITPAKIDSLCLFFICSGWNFDELAVDWYLPQNDWTFVVNSGMVSSSYVQSILCVRKESKVRKFTIKRNLVISTKSNVFMYTQTWYWKIKNSHINTNLFTVSLIQCPLNFLMQIRHIWR